MHTFRHSQKMAVDENVRGMYLMPQNNHSFDGESNKNRDFKSLDGSNSGPHISNNVQNGSKNGKAGRKNGLKRPSGYISAPQPKKRKNNDNTSTVTRPQQKNTVAILNELRQGLIYKLESQTGPVHAPIFRMSVVVDGQTYYGEGTSKKIARVDAASTALRSFIQFKDGATLSPIKLPMTLDFTSDEHTDEATKNVINKKQVPEKGPVMLLYELFSDVQIDCVQSDGAQPSRFKMVSVVNKQRFEGTGPSKKLAKNAAAKAALAALCDISYSPMQSQSSSQLNPTTSDKKETYELSQPFADAIGKLVLEKFMEITVGIENYNRRKVLAGIVMIESDNLNTAKVVTVSTGTKCVNGEHMSISGTVLNDSHAEIVSRRCLIDFFYNQLALHTNASTSNESIFLRPIGGEELYKVRDDIKFHLYINTAPCGDARIFSPHEDDICIDKHPNRKARGQLRTKIESGEGTIPVKSSEGIQTWDGVIQGQRLLTMSCSDKIARWNVLGLQGALLSSIVHPIYLQSIVLGSLLHPAHMYRAVCGRIESAIQGLPPPYHLNKPKFALVTSAETRNQIKAPNFGINWTYGCNHVEIVNSLTGKTINNKISRITKQTFFVKYANLIKQLPNVRVPRNISMDYSDLKASVRNYQIGKKELFDAFKREDLGNWLKKPLEQDQFYLPK